jgi:hypothetical protein
MDDSIEIRNGRSRPVEMINGVGKDTETITTEGGGKHSKVPYDILSMDAFALLEAGSVMYEGKIKYGKDNWRLISTEEHIEHLIVHSLAWLAGDRSDKHLAHSLCRAIFAVATNPENPSPLQTKYLESLKKVKNSRDFSHE